MTTVRISPEDDKLLEQIRSKNILKGIKMSKNEILSELIRKSYHEMGLLANNSVESIQPLDEDPAWLLLRKPLKWGIKDTSTTVDQYLYKDKE